MAASSSSQCALLYTAGVCVDGNHLKEEYSIRHRDIRVSTKMSFKVTTLHYEQVLPAICEMCQFMCMKLKAKHTYSKEDF